MEGLSSRAAIRALLATRGTRVVEAADGSAEIIGAAHGRIWVRSDWWAEFKDTLKQAPPPKDAGKSAS